MPPRGGNLSGFTSADPLQFWFQLMPPRGGNRAKFQEVLLVTIVSTHAPARGQSCPRGSTSSTVKSFNSCPREGAIIVQLNKYPPDKVSTHAPARGQSLLPIKPGIGKKRFQLMPPRGGNLLLYLIPLRTSIVSTHAPARGQSSDFLNNIFSFFQFQLMPPRGGNL